MTTELVRLNIQLPADVANDLFRLVPPRKRGRFIARLISEELGRMRLRDAIEMSAGSWRDDDHPELSDGVAINGWIATSRRDLRWDRQSQP